MKRRNFISHSSLIGAAATLAPVTSLQAQTGTGPVHADLIIKSARIYTMDESRPLAEAVAIMGDRILAVGSDSEMSSLQGPLTRVIDATGLIWTRPCLFNRPSSVTVEGTLRCLIRAVSRSLASPRTHQTRKVGIMAVKTGN